MCGSGDAFSWLLKTNKRATRLAALLHKGGLIYRPIAALLRLPAVGAGATATVGFTNIGAVHVQEPDIGSEKYLVWKSADTCAILVPNFTILAPLVEELWFFEEGCKFWCWFHSELRSLIFFMTPTPLRLRDDIALVLFTYL